jgi:hypothetical protein
MKKNAPPKLQKLSAVKQRRLHQLLDKNGEGGISRKEKFILEQLVSEAEEIMVANAKRLAEFTKREAAVRPPAGAVPVTVWVQPEHAER